MSSTPQEILHSFDILPQPDQRVVANEILRRAAHWDSEPLMDDELCREADALFKTLDEREEQDAGRPSG